MNQELMTPEEVTAHAAAELSRRYALPCPEHIAHGNFQTCAACQAMPVKSHVEHIADYEAAAAKGRAELVEVRRRMKARKYTIVFIAGYLGKSTSFIGDCLRGNYPHRGAGALPLYLLRYLKSHNLYPEDTPEATAAPSRVSEGQEGTRSV